MSRVDLDLQQPSIPGLWEGAKVPRCQGAKVGVLALLRPSSGLMEGVQWQTKFGFLETKELGLTQASVISQGLSSQRCCMEDKDDIRPGQCNTCPHPDPAPCC